MQDNINREVFSHHCLVIIKYVCWLIISRLGSLCSLDTLKNYKNQYTHIEDIHTSLVYYQKIVENYNNHICSKQWGLTYFFI